MMIIHGMSTVNCGEIKQFNGVADPIYKGRQLVLEILEPKNHNPNTQIVCYYYWDTKLDAKVEVTLYRHIKDKTWGSEIYYFKGAKESQHYYSRNYPNFIKMPKKYYDIIKYIHPYFIQIFGN